MSLKSDRALFLDDLTIIVAVKSMTASWAKYGLKPALFPQVVSYINLQIKERDRLGSNCLS